MQKRVDPFALALRASLIVQSNQLSQRRRGMRYAHEDGLDFGEFLRFEANFVGVAGGLGAVGAILAAAAGLDVEQGAELDLVRRVIQTVNARLSRGSAGVAVRGTTTDGAEDELHQRAVVDRLNLLPFPPFRRNTVHRRRVPPARHDRATTAQRSHRARQLAQVRHCTIPSKASRHPNFFIISRDSLDPTHQPIPRRNDSSIVNRAAKFLGCKILQHPLHRDQTTQRDDTKHIKHIPRQLPSSREQRRQRKKEQPLSKSTKRSVQPRTTAENERTTQMLSPQFVASPIEAMADLECAGGNSANKTNGIGPSPIAKADTNEIIDRADNGAMDELRPNPSVNDEVLIRNSEKRRSVRRPSRSIVKTGIASAKRLAVPTRREILLEEKGRIVERMAVE